MDGPTAHAPVDARNPLGLAGSVDLARAARLRAVGIWGVRMGARRRDRREAEP